MKFKILVRLECDPKMKPWEEPYDKEEVTSKEEAEEWGRATIQKFNETLRPHEQARAFVGAEVEAGSEESHPEHQWTKTNLTTIMHPKWGPIDRCKCVRCGITGHRRGVGAHRRDPKFRSKVYERCDTALEHLAKKEAKAKLGQGE